MINRIKNKLRKVSEKLDLLVKLELDKEEKVKEMSSKQRKLFVIKKIATNPKRLFNVLIGKEFNISYVEIPLTTVCTLNCKGCSALMNHYKKPEHIDLKHNIKALERLVMSCDTIRHLRLLGGEPLSYPYLYDILCFTEKEEKIKRVTIVTNGTLLINDNRVIEILKNKKFDVFISDYGEFSRKKDELFNQLNENHIKCRLADKDKSWRDYGDLTNRNRSKKELEKQFFNCGIECNSLLNGKLHHCPRSSHGTNLNKLPLKECDYVDLLDDEINSKVLRKKLYRFFYGYVPYIEACNYCNRGTNQLKSIPAGQQYRP